MNFRALMWAVIAICLAGCNSDSLDLEAGFSINNEQVFSTVSSIEEVLAEPNGTDPTYTKTKYPIVLVHGLYGFDQVLGIDYWYRVAEAIELGGGTVYTIPVPKLNTTEVRGEYLLQGLYDLQALTGASKFHLMGHSHGGPTVRYIIDADPDLLASVTTISGLNVYGSGGSDAYVDALTSFFEGPLYQTMLNGLAELIEAVGGNKENHQSYAAGSFRSLSQSGVAEYNQSHNYGLPAGWDDNTYDCVSDGPHSANINGNDIYFYSWSGNSIKTNVLDPIDLLIAYTGARIGSPSDGMVEQCASHFGKIIRSDYDLNHLDVMNWAFALRRATATNPLSIYRMTANTLKQLEIDQGL